MHIWSSSLIQLRCIRSVSSVKWCAQAFHLLVQFYVYHLIPGALNPSLLICIKRGAISYFVSKTAERHASRRRMRRGAVMMYYWRY